MRHTGRALVKRLRAAVLHLLVFSGKPTNEIVVALVKSFDAHLQAYQRSINASHSLVLDDH